MWAYSQEQYQEHIKENLLYWGTEGKAKFPRFKKFLSGHQGVVNRTLWHYDDVNHTQGASTEYKKLDLPAFDTPKPTRLIERIIQIAADPDDIILDSFAGSGTTAHAVLNMNKADGGNRKFILVEMMDYADSITAERVKRVIDGYGEGKNAVEGAGGNFSFYDLGEPLLIGDNLNEAVDIGKIREYIWFMETKTPYAPPAGDNPYYLGRHNDTSYYFYYEPQRITVLDYAFLATFTQKAGGTMIYADRCAIGEEKLARMGIVFKKIPRDITRL